MKLSIVIPAFNCENTLEECVNSLSIEEKHYSDVEVLIIDDGSSDNTAKIAKKIVNTIPCVKYFYQSNTGAGAARNLGLKHINGDYVWFIDGDDTVNQNSISIILYEIETHHPEILLFSYKLYDEAKNQFVPQSKRDSGILGTIEEGQHFTVNDHPNLLEAISYPWNKVYKSEFIKDSGLLFSETIVNNDIYFNICSLCLGRKIVKIGDELYTHVINKVDGQLTQIFDERRLNLIGVLDQTERKIRSLDINIEAINCFLSFKFNVLDWAITRTSGSIKYAFIDFLNEGLKKLTPYEYLIVSASSLFTANLKSQATKLGIPKAGVAISGDELMLSVIVPIYNVEAYLRKCLQSISNQTLNPRSFEVIMVDDKSTDASAQIALEFTRKYSNFKLIQLEKNTPGGAGIPSNIGINAAKGKYIGFVDSDDYIEPIMFEEMLMVALKEDSDVCICDFNIYYEKEKRISESNDQKVWKNFVKTIIDKKGLRAIKSQMLSLSPVPWRKIYKRDFLNSKGIRYPECEYFFEDNPLHWFVTTQLRKLSVVNKALITHRIGRVGQTMEGKPEKLIGFASHAETIKFFLDDNSMFDEFKLDYLQWYLSQTSWVLPRLGKLKSKYLRVMRSLCKEYTLADVKAARKIKTYKYARLFYNYGLIKGRQTFGQISMLCVSMAINFMQRLKLIK